MNKSFLSVSEFAIGVVLGGVLFVTLLLFLNQQTYSPKSEITQRFFKYQGY